MDTWFEHSGDARHDRTALGERRLMAAVLLDALDVLSNDPRHPSDVRLRAETWNWVMAYDREWPFSFDNVCEALGLDPDVLRARVEGLGQPPVPHVRPRLRREAQLGSRMLRLVG